MADRLLFLVVRIMLRLAAIATAIALVAGCGTHAISGNGKPAPEIARPTKPVPPEVRHENTDFGARATAGYWLVLFDYTLLTGDEKALLDISTSDCQECIQTAAHVRSIYDSGAHIIGQLGTIGNSTIDYSEQNLRVITMAYNATELTKIDKQGKASNYSRKQLQRYQLKLQWIDSVWKVAEVSDVSN